MLPTFVIGLREGLEAALIVGIVAAFLSQRGRRDLLRLAFLGVGAAVVLCLAIGIALDIVSNELPQRQQEGLETVIGACAVTMVTYMVVWMRRHSRTLKAQLEGAASDALAAGSGLALVAMAFLAVLREGLETVVFLLAAFNETGSGAAAGVGAILGIAVAVVLGWGIYRGGVRLNLSRFFRITGVVLTLVAAGLVVSALHTAHEAGWLTIGQQSTVDLSGLVRPGSVSAALLTGMLGVQPQPVLVEVIGWLVYLVPVGVYIVWPPGRSLARTTTARILAATGAVALAVTAVLVVLIPARPATDPVTRAADASSAVIVSRSGSDAVIRASVPTLAGAARLAAPGPSRTLSAVSAGAQQHSGLRTDAYTVRLTEPVAGAPSTMTYAEVSAHNGGRLPLGVRAGDGVASVPVHETSVSVGTFWVVAATGRIVDVRWQAAITLTAQLTIGPTVLGTPSTSSWTLPVAASSAAASSAHADARTLARRSWLTALAVAAAVLAVLTGSAAGFTWWRRSSRPAGSASRRTAVRPAARGSELVNS